MTTKEATETDSFQHGFSRNNLYWSNKINYVLWELHEYRRRLQEYVANRGFANRGFHVSAASQFDPVF
jgi:hypothetical protein